jgi:predicted ATPase
MLCPVLVGRGQEKQVFEQFLARASERIGGMVVLLGLAGIGKSRLGREVVAHARAR